MMALVEYPGYEDDLVLPADDEDVDDEEYGTRGLLPLQISAF
jgi:hypothetical protein